MTKRTSESIQKWLRYLFIDELAALKRLAADLPPDPTIVNIGAGGGTSGLAFMESRGDLHLITIDIQDESSPFGCLEAERRMLLEAGYPKSMQQKWNQIHGDSKTVSLLDPVDMAFIDGDHSYEGCAGDIAAWWPQIKPGGIMAIHDYDKERVFLGRDDAEVTPHSSAWPDVDRAVSEFIETALHEKYEVVDTLIVLYKPGQEEVRNEKD